METFSFGRGSHQPTQVPERWGVGFTFGWQEYCIPILEEQVGMGATSVTSQEAAVCRRYCLAIFFRAPLSCVTDRTWVGGALEDAFCVSALQRLSSPVLPIPCA